MGYKTAADRVEEGADIIDSRDVIARIEELEGEREAVQENAHGPADSGALAAVLDSAALKEWDESDEGRELTKLRALAAEAESSPDWRHGEALIADHYFEEYARDLADDIGAVNANAGWPNSFIDWKRAAEALQQDYTSVTYGETTYWIRS